MKLFPCTASSALLRFTALVTFAVGLSACTATPAPEASSVSSVASLSAPMQSSHSAMTSSAASESVASSSADRSSISSFAANVSSSAVSLSSMSSSLAASSVASMGCNDDVSKGNNLYNNNCQRCHGDIPTHGATKWTANGRTIDIFDQQGDGYKTRDGSQVFETLASFIDIYMPSMNNTISELQAKRITAYITHQVQSPWCPGDDWPEPTMGGASSDASSAQSSSASNTGPVRVLAYSGYADDNHWDKHQGGARLKNFGGQYNLAVTHIETGAELTKVNYNNFDVLVFIGTLKNGAVPNGEKTRIENWVKAGGAFVGYYQAVNTEKSWGFYQNNMLAGKMTQNGHAHDGDMNATVTQPDHPIMQGVPATFKATGRIGVYWATPSEDSTILMTGSGPYFDKNGTKWKFNNTPILWTRVNAFGGRTVFSQLAPPQGDKGNKFDATPWFQAHMAQMIHWAANRL